MKTKTLSLLLALLLITVLTRCAWDRYTTFARFSSKAIPREDIAVVVCQDANLKITRIDDRSVQDWGWNRESVSKCLLEFLPGQHHLVMTYLEKPSNVVGMVRPEEYTIQVSADLDRGRIYRLSPTLAGNKHSAKLEDVTDIPKYQKIVESNQ